MPQEVRDPSAARRRAATEPAVGSGPVAGRLQGLPAAALPLAGVVAVVAVLLAAASSGAFAAPELADPGAWVRRTAPVVTALGHLAAAVTVGALLLVVTVLPGPHPSPAGRSALVLAGGAASSWALLMMARAVLGYATVTGVPPSDPAFGEQLGVYLTQVSSGRVLLTVALLAALAAALALAVTGPVGAATTLVVVGVALALLAETGHASGAADHETATTAMALHLMGAAAWLGGLAALVVLAPRIGGGLPAAARRFSAIALWAFLAVAVSGLVSAWLRLGGPAGLGTPYGRLVVVKALLLVLLGAAGHGHRRLTLPRLDGGPTGHGARSLTFWRLAAVELLVMGAAIGVAVALAGSPPPVPDLPPSAPSPVESVTGYPAPPEPGTQTWLTIWRPDLLFVLLALVMAVVYTRWLLRLRRRGDAWPAGRVVGWLVGVVVLAWVTSGPPAVYGQVLFSTHMLQHMVLAMVVPLLLCLGAPVTLALRALPVRKDGSRGPREWLLALVESRWARFAAHPVVAALAFAGSMIVFYTTPLFPWALSTHVGHIAMVVHFTLVGYLFANALVGADPGPRRPPYPMRLLVLFGTMAFHAFFGVAIAQSTVLLAADRFGALGLPWGVDALADQQQGANLAWAFGEVPTLVLAAVVAIRWAHEDERAARRSDRAADRDGDAALDAYNRMLARLGGRDEAGVRAPDVTASGSPDRGPTRSP